MTQPPGYYGQPGYGDPYGQQPPQGGGYGQPQQPGYGDPYGQPVTGGPQGYDPYGQPVTGQPSYGAPPPMFPPAPPPKKSSKGLVITLVAVVAALVICGGVATVGFLLLRGGSPTGVVETFLGAVKDYDAEKAKENTCAAEKSDVDTLVRNFKQANIELSWTDVEEKSSSGDKAEVTARITTKGTVNGQPINDTSRVRFDLVKEGGDWKVCGDQEEG